MSNLIVTQKKYIYSPEKVREYNKRMYDKNKERERFECPICFGVYTYYNKSHHNNSELHKRAVKYIEQVKEKKMNPPTLDTQISGTLVYLDENHFCEICKGIFQDDEVHLCNKAHVDKITIGEEIKEEDKELLINGILKNI